VLIQSRHIKRTKYRLIIVYSPDKEDISAIECWKCSFSVGIGKLDVPTLHALYSTYLVVKKETLKKPGYSLKDIFSKTGIQDSDIEIEESTIINTEKTNDVECKIKRKMSTNSSLETVVIRPRFKDTLIY
jgi:hypothetical protein